MKLRISVMGCVRKLALAVCAAVCSGSALAEVVAWYRFSELDPGVEATTSTVIENYANPGTIEGTVNTYGSSIGSGGVMPVGATAFGSKLQIYDPLTGQYHVDNRAMHFGTRDAIASGATEAPGSCYIVDEGSAGVLDTLTNITVEAIFRLNPDVPNGFTACLVDKCGPDGYKNRWSLMINSNGLWSRYRYCDQDGSNVKEQEYLYGGAGQVTRGVWHHAALTFDANGDSKLWLDYTCVRPVSVGGKRLNPGKGMFAIGCNPKVSNRTFPGEIDEVRISDCALDPSQFLRVKPVVEGMDPDTVFYHPLDFDEGAMPIMAMDINAATNAGALSAKFVYLDFTNSVPQGSTDIPGSTGQLRQNVLAPANANGGSMYSVTNVPNKATSIRVSDPTRSIYTGSFTAEMFFKGDTSKINPNGSVLTLMWGQLKVYVSGKGGTRARAYEKQNGYTAATSEISLDSMRLMDGQWHHVAVVYDYAPSNFTYYVDYVPVGSKTTRIYEGSDGSTEFYFGRQVDADSQHFIGWQDSPRIVRRALKPHEFLTSTMREVATPASTLAHVDFDTDFSVKPFTQVEKAGTAAALSGGSDAQITESKKFSKVWLDGLSKSVAKPDVGCVRMDGSQARFPYNSLLERPEFTIEFFAKIETSGYDPHFVRLNRSPSMWNISSTWALGFNRDTRHLSAHAYMRRSDGTFNDVSPDFSGASGKTVPTDGRWHHYALTSQLVDGMNTMLTAYIDYEPVGDPITVEGVFYYPPMGTALAIGAGDSITGYIDEFRFSDGVLPVSSFMRKEPYGLTIIFR